MTFDRDKVLRIARAEIGVIEESRRNDHPRIEAYLNKLPEPPRLADRRPRDRGLAWCAAFILWVLWRAGCELRGVFWEQRRVARLLEDAREMGAVLGEGEAIEPCDLLVWLGARSHSSAGPSGHVAMVTTVGPEGELRTIGGNERIDAQREGVRERWILNGDHARITAIIRPSRMLREVA